MSARTKAPLEGLLSGRPKRRKRFYIGFAIANLTLSLTSGLLIFGLIPVAAHDLFSSIVAYLAWALTTVGTAFGMVAASNVSEPTP